MRKIEKATAISPANIAFIKFWGKRDHRLNLPFNDSISMNLSGCKTTTTVEFGEAYKEDSVTIDGNRIVDAKKERVVAILNIIRQMAGRDLFARVVSQNNFPSDSGIASSASAFSALALAGSKALGLNLSLKELSILARLGSGSASRSVVDGFALWRRGKSNTTSYAVQLAKPSYWDLVDLVTIVTRQAKKSGSTEGHGVAMTSPYYRSRLKILPGRIVRIKKALLARNIERFGELLEKEAVDLHVIAMTSTPPIFYWNQGTMAVMHELIRLREKGVKAYFTMDAGANVHVICEEEAASKIKRSLEKLPEVLSIIKNKPDNGTRLVAKHLF